MEIDKALVLPAPPSDVWALLLDPQAMGACVPGMQSIEVISPDEYLALMQVKIAFISARFKLRTRIVERREPEYLKAEGTGEDAAVASSLKQTTEITLAPHPDGGTDLRLKVQVDLLGRMGSFGMSTMKTKADRLWDEFGVNMQARLAAGGAAAAAASAAPAGASTIATPAGGPAPAAQADVVADAAPAGTEAPAATPAAAPPARAAAQASPPAVPAAPATPAALSADPGPPGWWPALLRRIGVQPASPALAAGMIVVEVRRPDQTLIRVEWPAAKSGECAQWLRDTLR